MNLESYEDGLANIKRKGKLNMKQERYQWWDGCNWQPLSKPKKHPKGTWRPNWTQMQQMDEITALEEESQSIDMLGKIEEAALAKLEKKMENAYFMEDLDAEDVSTVLTWTLCSPDSKRRIFTTTSE